MFFVTEERVGGRIVKNIINWKCITNMKRTINLSEIEDPVERKILKLLNEQKVSLYGDIFKNLKISIFEGQKVIFSLLSQKLIRYKENTFYLELNVNLG